MAAAGREKKMLDRLSLIEAVQEALLEKIRELPGHDIEKVREYIQEIEQVGNWGDQEA